MPIFERYRIDRYKEILTNQPAGTVSDGGFSSYNLDDPSTVPNGTGDFLGIIKTVILLGEIYKETIDTRNISFAEFNNLTQQQFDDYVSQGLILLNRQTNGQPERIGWVEMGRSYASFYYQSCQGGKIPVSEHYFDLNEFVFDNKTVIGEGPEIEPTEALTPIGNFDPNIANNLGVLRPRFEPLNLTDYVRFAMVGLITNSSGETARINDLALTEQTRPTQVSLLMANRGDHFDNQFATEVSPGKWGMVRRTIFESIKPGIHVVYPQLGFSVQQTPYTLDFSISEGRCLQTTTTTSTGGAVVIGGGVTTTTPQTGGPTLPPMVISDTDIISNNLNTKVPWDWGKIGDVDRRVKVTREYRNKTCFSLIHDFPESLKQSLLFLQNSIDINEISGTSAGGNILNGNYPNFDYALHSSRLRYLLMSLFRGDIPYINSDIPDIMDTLSIPRGTIRKEVNPNTGCFELTYIGTPNGGYVGPQIFTPSAFSYDASMDEPTPLVIDFGGVRIDRRGKSNQPFSESEIYFMKRGGASLGINNGRGWWDTWGGIKGGNLYYGGYQRLFELVEEERPIYIHASDQKWQYGNGGFKSITISNRGGTRVIITDYSPRGCANFVNVGLLNSLPIVLNPLEEVEFLVEYVPRNEGLQPWKGKQDPFPALISEVEPDNHIFIEYEIYVEIPQLGYLPLGAIPEDPRPNNRWSFSKRNKNWSKLEIITDGTIGR